MFLTKCFYFSLILKKNKVCMLKKYICFVYQKYIKISLNSSLCLQFVVNIIYVNIYHI